MADLPTFESFHRCLGDAFEIADDELAVEVSLIEAAERDGLDAGGMLSENAITPFTLLFRGPMEPILPQQIYRVSHSGLGAHDLFLVPIGPDAEGMRYEAVFC